MHIDLDELHAAAPIAAPPIVQKAVAEFANDTRLDVQKLLAGDRFQVGGVKFQLQRDSSIPPHCVWIQMEVCELEDKWALEAATNLLSRVEAPPEWPPGHYSTVAASNLVAYCTLADLRLRPKGAEVIALLVARLSLRSRDICDKLFDMLGSEGEHPAESVPTLPRVKRAIHDGVELALDCKTLHRAF